MKLFFAFIIFISTYQFVLGQFPSNKEKIDFENVYTISEDNGIDLISYYYSPKGEITQIVQKTKSNITNGKTEYLYNQDRQIQTAKKYTLISNSSELKYSGKEEYIYDSIHNIKEIRISNWGLNQPSNTLEQKILFEYHSNNLLNKKTEINYKYNGVIGNTIEYVFKYNEKNQLIAEIRLKNNKLWMINKFTYNEQNNIIKEESFFPIENNYYYADSRFTSNLTQVEYGNYQIESKPRETASYNYNSEGFLINIINDNHYLNSQPYSINFKYQTYSESELKNSNNDISFYKTDEDKMIETMKTTIEVEENNQTDYLSFIPILSQFKNEQPTKGLILIGGIYTSGYLGYNFKKKADDKYNNYKTSTDVDEILSLYDDSEKLRKQSIACTSISGALILYAIIDGYIVNKNKIRNSNITLSPNFNGKNLVATLSIKL